MDVAGADVDEVVKVNLMLRSAATTPDVLSIPTSPVGALAVSGYLEPLNRYVATWPTWRDSPAAVRAENTVDVAARSGAVSGRAMRQKLPTCEHPSDLPRGEKREVCGMLWGDRW